MPSKDKRFTYSTEEYLKAKEIIKVYEYEFGCAYRANLKPTDPLRYELWELKTDLSNLYYNKINHGWDGIYNAQSKWRIQRIKELMREIYKK